MSRLPPLELLYQSHGPAVLRRARQILEDEAEAEEVLHDVFTSLLLNPDQFSGRCSPMTFLYRMTTNCALGRLRSRRTHRRLLEAEHGASEEPSHGSPEARVELQEWLASLPDELAQLAIYHYLDELTQDEIASVLGCSRQWVGKLIARLRAPARRRPNL